MSEDTVGLLSLDFTWSLFFLSFPFFCRRFCLLDLGFHFMDFDVSTSKGPAVFIRERVGGNFDGKSILPSTRIAIIHYFDPIGVSFFTIEPTRTSKYSLVFVGLKA